MKAHVLRHVLRRRKSNALVSLLVICCSLALIIGTRECDAREISTVGGDAAVKQVREESRIEGGQGLGDGSTVAKKSHHHHHHRQSDDEIGTISGKDDKTIIGTDVEKTKKIVEEPQLQPLKTFKRLTKRPIRRQKRSKEIPSVQGQDINFGVIGKSDIDDKRSEISDHETLNKRVDVEGIRRLDVNVDDGEKKGVINALKVDGVDSTGDSAIVKANVDDRVETENSIKDKIATEGVVAEKTIEEGREKSVNELREVSIVGGDEKIQQVATSRAETLSRLEQLKAQALEFQSKIRNNTFLQSLKNTMADILPGIPKFTENQFLEILKNITAKTDAPAVDDFDADKLKESGLTGNQIEILKCAQQLVAKKERQSFFENMSECIKGLSALNCMRIFIYPIIVENMPDVFTQGLQKFPIEINVSDWFQGNRDKPKSGRQVPLYNYYMKQMDPDALIFDILRDGLSKYSLNENLPSYIAARNESFSKLLTCNKMQLLQMTEKFLPENERPNYSDEMLSCVRRFEYFSCIKYFSWPAMKKYYPGLPQFPLSDSYLSSLIYPNYPLITYPGYESGFSHLPEIVDSGPARMKPETVILQIFKKTLTDYARIPTTPTPIQLDLYYKSQPINPEQMATIHLAEQLLPINLRTEYVSKVSQCIKQFDYYNCMRYVTWPIVRQNYPTIPSFQDIINNFQIPNIPNPFELFSQFQWPQFPSFSIPNFSIPDFSGFNPFGQQTPSSTPKPSADSPPDSVTQEKKDDSLLESQVYKILKNVRDSMGATPLSQSTYTNRKVFLFPLMSEEQSKIFALAESIVPPIDREPLITSMYFCLNDKNAFSTCTKTIIWPSLRNYIRGLPDFPLDDAYAYLQQKMGLNVPAVPFTGSGDNFFIMREIEKFFIEGREDAMKFILRSIQLSSPSSLNMQRLLDILRSIQFNAPEFLNAQLIQYPRAPEFASILTENQENIVHTVESILPMEIRQKFQNDMIECLQKNKFPTCSRNIIFPSIYRYFQNALSIPYNVMSDKKIFPKNNVVDPKIAPAKQEENFMAVPDKKITFFPPNPESVILSMIRKMQISYTASLPTFPKESIANTAEFRKLFNIRQAHILTMAEAILPEDYRKGFLEEMFKCAEKDTFLNCSRDIMFPLMKKAYSDFPDFPNFDSDLDRAKMLQIINNLKETAASPKSYDSKRAIPSMEPLYKLVSDDGSDKLRLLVEKLPDSLYYGIYLKMAQCGQFSDSITCSHDIAYPVLKHYYDAPDFNLDDYYPTTAQPTYYSAIAASTRSPYNYEIVCENMGFSCTLEPFGSHHAADGSMNVPIDTEISYMPFGRLSDGSRIFKRSQDIWNLNFTPSVGAADKTRRDFADGQSASFLSSINEKSTPSRSADRFSTSIDKVQNPTADQTIDNLKRNKRNVDDLLDSYPDAVPVDKKKNSVPRRIPPKLSFPNITETELLQMLVHITKLKNEPTPGNEDIITKDYYVDTLNETDRARITADQYEILKIVQGLNTETARASFMSKLFQCVRGLSFIRCVGIFVWPMIASNLPSLPFNLGSASSRDARVIEEMQMQEMFGLSSSEFEAELMRRKERIESNFIDWYKELTENKFEKYIGPLKIMGHGNGELAIKFAGHREGRLSKIKDNKNLPSILTIISDVIEEVFESNKSNKSKGKKDNSKNEKRGRNLFEYDTSENQKRSVKDDQVVNMLLERLRPSVSDIKDEDMKRYFSVEDAYRAFQVLFGPKVSSRITDQLKSIENDRYRHYESDADDSTSADDVSIVPLKMKEKMSNDKFKVFSSRSRSTRDFDDDNDESNKLAKFKRIVADYINRLLNANKKNIQRGLTVRLPRLNDDIQGRKLTNGLISIGRDMKKKMSSMIPAAGIAATFAVQLALAHLKAAANVSNLLSNMALGSAMLGMLRDMIFRSANNHPNVKYVYEPEKYDTGVSWTPPGSDPWNRYSSPYA